MNYTEYVNRVVKTTKIRECDIFDFRDTPLEFACATVIEGYCNFNNTIKKHLGVEGVICFISNCKEANARSALYGRIGIIELNMGLVLRWKDLFLENEKIKTDSYLKSRLDYMESNYHYNIRESLFKTASLYTFYHELAHVIQFKERKEKGAVSEERYSKKNIIPLDHLKEIDADIFSSLTIADQIIFNLFDKLDISKKNEQFLGDFISLNAASLFVTILSFSRSLGKLYFNVSSHPHPSIRNVVVTSHFVTQLLENLRFRSMSVNIHEEQILESVFALASYMFGFEAEIAKIKVINSKNEIDIENYYAGVLKKIEQSKWSAIRKRDLISKGKIRSY